MPPRRVASILRPTAVVVERVVVAREDDHCCYSSDDDDNDSLSASSSASSCESYCDEERDRERFPLRKKKTNRSSSLFTAEELLQELSTNEDDEEHGRIVLGRWRDSGTSCWGAWFRHGYCHASVMTSCCCTPCAAGQVATRLHVTPWSAQPITHVTVGRAKVFATIVQWCAVYWMSRLALLVAIACLDPNAVATVVDHNSNSATPDVIAEPGVAYYVCCAVDDLLVWLYIVACAVQLRNLRRMVRLQYQIPAGTVCGERWEDTVCAVFCPCWVAAQLLRHTANYDHERPARWPCCSATGLAPVVAV